jgi:hypothetical protein
VGLQREFAGEGATKKTASELVAAIGATVEGDGVRNREPTLLCNQVKSATKPLGYGQGNL